MLYQIIFGSYACARDNLQFLGWVETYRSTSAGQREPSEVHFFNKLVGGNGRLFAADDGWVFLAPDGWLSKVYKRLAASGVLTSPSEDARRRKLEAASQAPSPLTVFSLFDADVP